MARVCVRVYVPVSPVGSSVVALEEAFSHGADLARLSAGLSQNYKTAYGHGYYQEET